MLRSWRSHLDYADVLERELAAGEEAFADAYAGALPGLNDRLERRRLARLTEKTREQWEQEQRR